jgi:hypothetical protein
MDKRKITMAYSFLNGIQDTAVREKNHGVRLGVDNVLEVLTELQMRIKELESAAGLVG